ncbi:MAG: hypothetical protein ACOCV1_08025 [Bacillota bacterium]
MKVLKGYQVIGSNETNAILYKKNKIYLSSLNFEDIQSLLTLKTTLFKKFMSNFRLFERMFRLNIRASLMLTKSKIVISKDSEVIMIDISKKDIKTVYKSTSNFSTPLCFSKPLTKEYLFLFGDYGSNNQKTEVKIYGVDYKLNIHTLYRFKEGKIRHIHNIVPKYDASGYYILTGDNEKNAGIYFYEIATRNMQEVLIGKSYYRSVAAMSIKSGLIYITDSVEEQNKVFLYDESQNKLKLVKSINGPSIYSIINGDVLYYSTSVESSEKGFILNKMLSTKTAKGVLSKCFNVSYINSDLDYKKMIEFKKDFLPYKLFQYGTVQFSSSLDSGSDKIYIYVISAKKFDNCSIILNK